MLWLLLSLTITNTILLVAVVVSKWVHRGEFIRLMQETSEEAFNLLRLNTDMATSARDNRKETVASVNKIEAKIDQVPDKTADKTAQKIAQTLPDRTNGG